MTKAEFKQLELMLLATLKVEDLDDYKNTERLENFYERFIYV